MKPYRLINTAELHRLRQSFQQILLHWCEEYSLLTLDLQLTPTPPNYAANYSLLLQQAELDLALLEGDYLSTIKYALFGVNQNGFNAVSQELFLKLMHQLFTGAPCSLQHHNHQQPDWFYAGSTSILLTLSCASYQFCLVLNPDWVYAHLPSPTTMNQLDSLDEALSEHQISLAVELTPSPLAVHDLIGIKVGDVLATNHLLTSPLRLIHQSKPIAEVELGTFAQHKSIILKRSS